MQKPTSIFEMSPLRVLISSNVKVICKTTTVGGCPHLEVLYVDSWKGVRPLATESKRGEVPVVVPVFASGYCKRITETVVPQGTFSTDRAPLVDWHLPTKYNWFFLNLVWFAKLMLISFIDLPQKVFCINVRNSELPLYFVECLFKVSICYCTLRPCAVAATM